MKKIIYLAMCAILILLHPICALAQEPPTKMQAVERPKTWISSADPRLYNSFPAIAHTLGKVEIKKEVEWLKADSTQVLIKGDSVRTDTDGGSACQIALKDTSQLFLAPDTEIVFKEVRNEKINVFLVRGKILIISQVPPKIEIETDLAQINVKGRDLQVQRIYVATEKSFSNGTYLASLNDSNIIFDKKKPDVSKTVDTTNVGYVDEGGLFLVEDQSLISLQSVYLEWDTLVTKLQFREPTNPKGLEENKQINLLLLIFIALGGLIVIGIVLIVIIRKNNAKNIEHVNFDKPNPEEIQEQTLNDEIILEKKL